MAVECPVTGCVHGYISREALSRFHVDGMLSGVVLTITVFQHHPHTVQVNGVIHHRVIDEGKTNSLAINEPNGFSTFGKFLAIEGPHVTLHVAGQMQLDFTAMRRCKG